jgi:hypothetical protein
MYLKREPPMSLPKAASNEELLLHARAARKDSAVHVSLSSDSLFKQPGDHGGPHPSVSRRAGEARASDDYRMPIHCPSEELQRRAIAPLADGAPIGVYRLRPEALSTKNAHFSWLAQVLHLALPRPRGRKVKKCLNLRRAALRPYSCVVLRVLSRDGIATGAFSTRQSGQYKGFGRRR